MDLIEEIQQKDYYFIEWLSQFDADYINENGIDIFIKIFDAMDEDDKKKRGNMREIEFRGKDYYNGEWVYGSLIITDRSYFIFTCNEDCDIGESYMEDAGGILILPETVGQYTGLKDKNGTKIFEGDIIKIPNDYDTYGLNAGEIYEIYFDYGGFRLKPKYNKNARGCWLEDNEEFEVIGNIYDNPELLEVKDED